MTELFIIATFTLLGTAANRLIGFGMAAFLMPVALIFLAPPVAVVTTILVGTLICAIVLFQTRRRSVVMPKMILRILLGALPGLLLGSYIVTRIDKSVLQMILGTFVIVAVLVQEYALPKPTHSLGVAKGISAAGFFSGLFNATAANGAPPLVMWFRTHKSTPEQIRQNIAATFMVVNLCSLTAIHYMHPQTFDRQVIGTFALLVPIIFIGNAAGTRMIERVDVKLYEKLVVIAVILTGLASIGLGAAAKI